MTTKVQILSEEMIKPSSPTPHHLRVLKLSVLEQLAPLEYVPVIYFYPPNCTTAKAAGATGRRSDRLKKSLSEILTRFYPLAGRIKDHISIECNDEGVLYVEAQVNCHLVEFLRDPDLKLLNRYLPFDMNRTSVDVQLGFQVNNFDCGGMALGVCLLHKIVDLATLSTFVNAWAATTARTPNYEVAVAQSSFISSSLFPPIDSLAGFVLNTPKLNFIGNFITRRYVFDESNIKALKLKASINGGGFYDKPPTTVEVITALIWRSAMAASRARHGTRRASVMAHAVNLRGRMAEPLPQHSMGSIISLATAYYSKSTGSDEKEELQGWCVW